MAENLNYEYSDNYMESYCFRDDENCEKFGRLYTWASAMRSTQICPEGWHVPSQDEWNKLISNAGGTSSAARNLKSGSGWYNNGNGTNSKGFSALPAGFMYENGSFCYENRYAYFWTSTTDFQGNKPYYIGMDYSSDKVKVELMERSYAFSVRCIKD